MAGEGMSDDESHQFDCASALSTHDTNLRQPGEGLHEINRKAPAATQGTGERLLGRGRIAQRTCRSTRPDESDAECLPTPAHSARNR